MATEGLPAPPPEAALLRLVRKARHVTVAEAAKAAGISKAWLSAIENGQDTRTRTGDGMRSVVASDEIVARLAAHLGVSPERLETEGQRPDAAAVLREIQRGQPEQPSPSATAGPGAPESPDGYEPRAPDSDGYVRPVYQDPEIERLARLIERQWPDLWQRDVANIIQQGLMADAARRAGYAERDQTA